MKTAEEILNATLRGTTEHRHRNNPKRNRILHIAPTWALKWSAGSTYGCGYGKCYVSGWVELVLIPEGMKCSGGFTIWDTGRDEQGPMTRKKLARIIEVCTEHIAKYRITAGGRVKQQLLEEFPYKKTKAC